MKALIDIQANDLFMQANKYGQNLEALLNIHGSLTT